MTGIRHRFLAIIGLAGAMTLGGCAYDDGYGYGGVSVGSGYYGNGGYYDDGLYGSPGFYQPGAYGGWYDNYYYPGSGYYIYDRGGRRHRWNDGQRRYWESRRAERGNDGRWRGRDRDGRDGNWDGRDRDGNWRDRDGRPGNGNATRPPRPPQGANDGRNWGDRNWGDRNSGRGQNDGQGRDRNGWRGNRPDGARPTPQPGLRQPQAQPQNRPQSRPQMNQPRPQRDWGGAGRQTRGREPAARVRPD
ncbi:peptidase [Sphingobium sp. Z007]|uniref:peptidase n=1 Tax=Sphingobium sp. Z007 TaxID=627495 RepID=UPI000B4985A3|nr:peptidase [Sphingobium sp. Z007]